jgi:acetyltransferase-like isoleucine patch superfamily enzyme
MLLAMACEPLTRLAALASMMVGRDANGTEMAIRGLLLGGGRRLRVGRNVRFIGPAGRFRLGANVCLYGETYLDANGPSGFVAIGADSHVDVHSTLYGQGGLTIGHSCALAAGTIIYTQTNADSRKDGTPVVDQPTQYAPVTLGDGCWLGAGTRILPGVAVGDGAHIAAGAVVTKDVDRATIVAGVPAHLVRARP